jgi:probable HAF family extracellular repeat protein
VTVTKVLCAFGILLACMPQVGKAIDPLVAYRVTGLGLLPGTGYSGANAINDLGEVTGGSGSKVFLWTPQTGMQDLGAPAGVIAAAGVGINNNGQIAVSTFTEYSSRYNAHAFRWSAGAFQDLGTLGGTYSTTYGIDATGRVAGYSFTSVGAIHAYRSTTGASPTDIDSLGGDYSVGYGINAGGQVVGMAYTSQNENRAFLWTGSGNMQDLGTLGGTLSQANDISDSGLIVGISSTADAADHAFIIQNGVMTDLGSLQYSSSATAVNDLGQVIGAVDDQPFVWDSVAGMRLLNNILDPATSDGWSLEQAFDINDSGQIVGQGIHDGVITSFLLTPVPEPSAIVLCALFGVAAGFLPVRRYASCRMGL